MHGKYARAPQWQMCSQAPLRTRSALIRRKREGRLVFSLLGYAMGYAGLCTKVQKGGVLTWIEPTGLPGREALRLPLRVVLGQRQPPD